MIFEDIEQYTNVVLTIMYDIRLKTFKNKMSHLKLQKILYVIYTYYYIYKSTKILKIQFQAWRWGPVIHEVWDKYKEYGAHALPLDKPSISIDEAKIILRNEYPDFYKLCQIMYDFEAWDLVEICHEESPWKQIYVPMKNIFITDEWIVKDHNENKRDFFEFLLEKLQEK